MLEIGINKNVRFGPESKVTDKGGFNLNLTQGDVIDSALDLLADDVKEAENGYILLFPPQLKKYGDNGNNTAIEIVRDIKSTYTIFSTMFQLYFTKDEIKKVFPLSVIMDGIQVDKDNQEAILTQESTISHMFKNVCEAALKVIKANKLWEKDEFRIKLLRQSPKKPYPRLTYKPEYSDWVELMIVPEEQSKVLFTAYEKSKGYDDCTIAVDVIDTVMDDAFDETSDIAVTDETEESFD